jgi:hypothetical protein
MTEETKKVSASKSIIDFPINNIMLEEVINKTQAANRDIERDLKSADADYQHVMTEYHKRVKQSQQMYANGTNIAEIKRHFLTPEDLVEELSDHEDILKWKSYGEKEIVKNKALIDKLLKLKNGATKSILLQKNESKKVLEVVKYSVDKIKVPDKYKYYPALKEKAEVRIKETRDTYRNMLSGTGSGYIKLIKSN